MKNKYSFLIGLGVGVISSFPYLYSLKIKNLTSSERDLTIKVIQKKNELSDLEIELQRLEFEKNNLENPDNKHQITDLKKDAFGYIRTQKVSEGLGISESIIRKLANELESQYHFFTRNRWNHLLYSSEDVELIRNIWNLMKHQGLNRKDAVKEILNKKEIDEFERDKEEEAELQKRIEEYKKRFIKDKK